MKKKFFQSELDQVIICVTGADLEIFRGGAHIQTGGGVLPSSKFAKFVICNEKFQSVEKDLVN